MIQSASRIEVLLVGSGHHDMQIQLYQAVQTQALEGDSPEICLVNSEPPIRILLIITLRSLTLRP